MTFFQEILLHQLQYIRGSICDLLRAKKYFSSNKDVRFCGARRNTNCLVHRQPKLTLVIGVWSPYKYRRHNYGCKWCVIIGKRTDLARRRIPRKWILSLPLPRRLFSVAIHSSSALHRETGDAAIWGSAPSIKLGLACKSCHDDIWGWQSQAI